MISTKKKKKNHHQAHHRDRGGRMFCLQNTSHDLYIWSRQFLSKTLRAGNEESSKVETSATTVTEMYWANKKVAGSWISTCINLQRWYYAHALTDGKKTAVCLLPVVAALCKWCPHTVCATHSGRACFRWHYVHKLRKALYFSGLSRNFFIIKIIIIVLFK